MVSHTSVAARDTGEGRLIGSVPLIYAAARPTSPGGVAWIDEQDRHACQSRLVGDEGSELTETPIVQPSALAGPGLNPAAYPLQVFKGDGPTGAFGLQHECFADAMVRVCLEPPLFAGQLPEPALRGFGVALLKSATAAGQLGAASFDCRARVGSSVTVGGDVDDAEIDAEHVGCFDQTGVVDVADDRKIPGAAYQHQIDFALPVGEQPSLMFAADIGDLLPPAERPDRQLIVGQEPEDTIIERLGTVRAKLPLLVSVDLVGIGHFAKAPDRNLSRQAEAVTKIAVADLLKGEVPKRLRLERHARLPVTSFIATLKRLLKQSFLLWRRYQLDIRNELHSSSIEGILR